MICGSCIKLMTTPRLWKHPLSNAVPLQAHWKQHRAMEQFCRGATSVGTGSGCLPAVSRAEAAISTPPLPVHLLDGPTADFQALGQFPLAHSHRPLHPDVPPLPLGKARPTARETALYPRLRLPRDRALPDRVGPPLAEGQHHRELGLTGGHGRVGVFPRLYAKSREDIRTG